MQLDTYLNFDGRCEEAFRHYAAELGGNVVQVTLHGAQADSAKMPAGWSAKVLHARLELGGATLMGADIPGAQPMRSAYLTLRLESDAEAERVYEVLKAGGEVFMPMNETAWASRFAMLRDQYGISWMLMRERAAPQ